MIVKLLTEHHVEFLSSKGGCTDSSESTLVKMPLCWKSEVTAHIIFLQEKGVDISRLATNFTISQPGVDTTLISTAR